jgi:hypothetical protein
MEIVSIGGERTLEEVLDEGVDRLKHKSTWKLWTWPPEDDEFYEAEAFRTFVLVRVQHDGSQT